MGRCFRSLVRVLSPPNTVPSRKTTIGLRRRGRLHLPRSGDEVKVVMGDCLVSRDACVHAEVNPVEAEFLREASVEVDGHWHELL